MAFFFGGGGGDRFQMTKINDRVAESADQYQTAYILGIGMSNRLIEYSIERLIIE